MKNPVAKSNLFTTPADMDHLVRLLNECGTKEEQRLAWYGAMIAMNLCHELFNQTVEESQDEILPII